MDTVQKKVILTKHHRHKPSEFTNIFLFHSRNFISGKICKYGMFCTKCYLKLLCQERFVMTCTRFQCTILMYSVLNIHKSSYIYQMSRPRGSASYSEGSGFKSLSGSWLSRLRYSVVSRSLCANDATVC
jgi:hypothetical protein